MSAVIIFKNCSIEIGWYTVRNVKIPKDYMNFGKDSYTSVRDELIKFDTLTGRVWVHEQGITSQNEDYDRWELSGEK